jgi:CspA family cold shock protein
MEKGKVKWFNSAKGYGFIEQEGGGSDVFIHISEVEKAGLSTLNDNQSVGYEVEDNKGKSSAIKLQLIN